MLSSTWMSPVLLLMLGCASPPHHVAESHDLAKSWPARLKYAGIWLGDRIVWPTIIRTQYSTHLSHYDDRRSVKRKVSYCLCLYLAWTVGQCGSEYSSYRQRRASMRSQQRLFCCDVEPRKAAKHHVHVSGMNWLYNGIIMARQIAFNSSIFNAS